MKKSNLLILTLILFSAHCKTKVQNSVKDNDLKKVEIRFVNLMTTTPIDVKCSDFEQYFDEAKIQSRILTDTSEWNALLEQINALTSGGRESNEKPDVRMTIELHYTDSTRSICVGNIVTSINGTNYLNSSTFRNFIEANFQE